MFHMNYVIEGTGAPVNIKGEETRLKASGFALVNPEGGMTGINSCCLHNFYGDELLMI